MNQPLLSLQSLKKPESLHNHSCIAAHCYNVIQKIKANHGLPFVLEKTMKKFEAPQLTIEDLSAALYEANMELQRMNDELTDINRSRTEMFANISHDLRSPLTAIKSSVEYLQMLENPTPEDYASALRLMDTRIRTLEALINDIFLLATLESKSLTMKFESFDVIPLVEEFFTECEIDSKYDSRTLSLDMPDSSPAIINADSRQLLRVLDNLFSNALKYSHDGDSITLKVEREGSELPCIRLSVIDTGIGIKPEDLENVFKRSFTADKARTPDAKTGFGLGLNIAREIVLQHGGNLTCTSTFGEGSCFTVELPIEK